MVVDEVTYYYMGSDRPFPRESELSLEVIRQAGKVFMASGGDRQSSGQWNELPDDVA